MKRVIFKMACMRLASAGMLTAITLFAASCSNEKKQLPGADVNIVKTETPRPLLAKPVKFTNWEIGDFNNVKTVVDMYDVWDKGKADSLAVFFADTLRISIAEERNVFVIPHNRINKVLGENRNMYSFTSNNIISAVALHDKDSNQDWVMVAVYAHWIEKNGKRDSIAFSDNWRIKDGKIDLLTSFTKLPTKQFLKSDLLK